jgi:Fe-S-cluster containining protein
MKQQKFFSRSLCQKCAQKQENCCSYYVPLTISDINKITAQGYKLNQFLRISRYSKTDLKNEENWWQNAMPKIGNYRCCLVIKLKKNGHCFFLKEGEGCLLGKNRPDECKIYPFWWENGRLVYQDNSCYLIIKRMTKTEILKIMGETAQNIKKVFLAFKKAFIKNKRKHQQIMLKLISK